MPKWVSGFERQPARHGMYFVKYNGERHLLRLDEFWRKINTAETFYWLDESEEIKESLDKIESIDDFAQSDRRLISDEVLTPYAPMVSRSEVMRLFHSYYLRQMATLRKQISGLSKEVKRQKNNGSYIPQSDKKDPLMERIRLLNKNPFLDIQE